MLRKILKLARLCTSIYKVSGWQACIKRDTLAKLQRRAIMGMVPDAPRVTKIL